MNWDDLGRVAPRDPPGWSFMVLPPFRMWGGSSMVILGTIPQGIVQFDMSDIAIALMPLKPDFDVLPQEPSDFNGTQNRTAASIPLCYDTSQGDETNRMYQMYHASIPQPQSMNHPIWKGERRKQLGDKWKAGTFCELRTPIRPPKLRAKTSNTLRPSQALPCAHKVALDSLESAGFSMKSSNALFKVCCKFSSIFFLGGSHTLTPHRHKTYTKL